MRLKKKGCTTTPVALTFCSELWKALRDKTSHLDFLTRGFITLPKPDFLCRSQASSSFWGHLMSRIIFWELKMWPNSLGWSRIIQETGPVITWHRRGRGIWSWKMYPWPDTRSYCNRHKGDIPRQWIDSLIYFSGIKNSIDSQEISQFLLNNTHTRKKENVLERNKQSAKYPIRHPNFLLAVAT